MEIKCKSCSGQLAYSPREKANICSHCGKSYPIEFDYSFEKSSINNLDKKFLDKPNPQLVGLRCESCGGHIILNKYELLATCPYCSSNQVVSTETVSALDFESILPFNISKIDALNLIKAKVKKGLFIDKKVYSSIAETQLVGMYINTFIFDFDTSSKYSGTLSYSVESKNSQGNIETKIRYKSVSGEINLPYRDVTIEANSKVQQSDIFSILPYDYSKVVRFKDEFMAGYLVEYPDKSIIEAYNLAKSRVNADVKVSILNKYACDRVVNLDLTTTYSNEKYNYTLLPLYILKPKSAGAKNVFINGQTGKISGLKLSGIKILLFVLLLLGGIALITAIVSLLLK